MLALRRFNNRLVLGAQTTSKTGSPVVYELKEQKPVLLKIQREISGFLQLAANTVKTIPLPHNYDFTTERLYCVFRVKGTVQFSIVTDRLGSNILIKGTSTQNGRYAVSDFFESISAVNPSSTETVQIQYTMFVVPDLSVDTNYFGLVSPLVSPSDSGGQGNMATTNGAYTYAGSARLDYTITSVDTVSWTTLIAAAGAVTVRVEIFDSSGETMELGVGTAGSESRVTIIPPGGIGLSLVIAAGDRICVRAISATASVGEIDISIFS